MGVGGRERSECTDKVVVVAMVVNKEEVEEECQV